MRAMHRAVDGSIPQHKHGLSRLLLLALFKP